MEKQVGQWATAVRPDDVWDRSALSDPGEPLVLGPAPAVGAAPARSAWGAMEVPYPDGLFGWNQPPIRPSVPSTPMDLVRCPGAVDVYREVHGGAAFQQVRRRYRRFVGPAAVAFLLWYFGYVVAAVTVPGLMARPVVGAVNVALIAGLAQFLTTFLLTWAYARHARRYRDRAALDLRWTVYERVGAHRSAAVPRNGSRGTVRGSGR